MWAEVTGGIETVDVLVYPFEATAKGMGVSDTVAMDLWFGRAALALIVIAGIVGIVGSLIIGKIGKVILVVAGILALLSIIIFAAGLQGELSEGAVVAGFPEVGLFSSGSFMGLDYVAYLCVGFWVALAAAIIAFISSLKHPMAPPAAPLTPAAPPIPLRARTIVLSKILMKIVGIVAIPIGTIFTAAGAYALAGGPDNKFIVGETVLLSISQEGGPILSIVGIIVLLGGLVMTIIGLKPSWLVKLSLVMGLCSLIIPAIFFGLEHSLVAGIVILVFGCPVLAMFLYWLGKG